MRGEDRLEGAARAFVREVFAALRTAKLDEVLAVARDGVSANDGPSRVRSVVRELASRRGLSTRETFILESFSLGWPRERVRGSLNVSPNTMKTYVKGVVQKTRSASLEGAALEVMRRALGVDESAAYPGPSPRPR